MRTAVAIPIYTYLTERNQYKKPNETNNKKIGSQPTHRRIFIATGRIPNCIHSRLLVCFLVHPQQATAQVWMMVFSWRVNGADLIPSFCATLLHVRTRMKPRSAADTLKLGVIPVVRHSFMPITL
nr:hypothetical protein ACMD2_05090 [Ipomoea batatas]